MSKEDTPDTFSHIANLLQNSNVYYLALVDSEGNYAYLNNYFLEKYASFYKDKEKRPAISALHPDDYAVSYETYLNCLKFPDQCFQVTLRKLNGKGGYIITHWDFKANVDADGSINGVVGIGYDITDFESRQDHIRFLSSTLKDVAYKQSHLIRRPLANIMGLVELLEQATAHDNVKSLVAMLKQSCQELNNEFDSFLIKDDINLMDSSEKVF